MVTKDIILSTLGRSQAPRMGLLVTGQPMGVIFQRRLLCAEAEQTTHAHLITSMMTVEGPTRG